MAGGKGGLNITGGLFGGDCQGTETTLVKLTKKMSWKEL